LPALRRQKTAAQQLREQSSPGRHRAAMYISDATIFSPSAAWPQGQNPWQPTMPAASLREPGSLSADHTGLGLLQRTPKPFRIQKFFYCSEQQKWVSTWVYITMRPPQIPWPSTPWLRADDNVRTGNITRNCASAKRRGLYLPNWFMHAKLEFGGNLDVVAPLKTELVDPHKSISTTSCTN